MSPELGYVRDAAEILKTRGKVVLGYITAELEPYSAQQKPDISFVPNDGPNAGGVYFVELRAFEQGRNRQGYLESLREHRSFAQEGAECEYAGFALATNAELDQAAAQELAESGVHYPGPVTSGAVLDVAEADSRRTNRTRFHARRR